MSNFFYDDDYDAFEHYVSDPVDYLTYGYGGFGYDTFDKPDDPVPQIVVQAGQGNLTMVKSLVENNPNPKLILNDSQRWTEADYRMSGFVKEYEWHGATPLIEAARKGHADVVEYLLSQGADPTLDGCVEENVYWDAFTAADESINVDHYNQAEKWMHQYPEIVNDKSLSPRDAAMRLHQVGNNGRRQCVRLLEAVRPFWNKASYASSQYSLARKDANYSNTPTNNAEMLKALQEVPPMPIPKEETLQDLAAKIESHRSVGKKGKKGKLSKPKGKKGEKRQDSTTKTKTRRSGVNKGKMPTKTKSKRSGDKNGNERGKKGKRGK